MQIRQSLKKLTKILAFAMVSFPITFIIMLECGVEIPFLMMNLQNIILVSLGILTVIGGLFVWGNSGWDTPEQLAQRILEHKIKKERERADQIYIAKVMNQGPAKEQPIITKKVGPAFSAIWDPTIQAFVEEHVKPYAKIIEKLDLLKALTTILEWLNVHGEVTSIGNDLEASTFAERPNNKKNAEKLKMVTLRDHSLNTTRIMMADLKKDFLDYHIKTGEVLICGLGHDLGKIRELRSGDDHFQDASHWIVSKQILEEIIPDGYRRKAQILNAVINHHGKGDSFLEKLLIKADRESRAKELREGATEKSEAAVQTEPSLDSKIKTSDQKTEKKYSYEMVDLSDIDMEKCLNIIGNQINMFNGSRHEALLIRGIVYINPKLISKTIGLLSTQVRVKNACTELSMVRNIEYSFRQLMDEHVPNKIGKNFTGQKYKVIMKSGETLHPMFFMPLKVSAFPDRVIAEAEERLRNNDFGSRIKKVEVAFD